MNYVDFTFQYLLPSGISNFTTSTALYAVPHSTLLRNGIFIVPAANLKIAQYIIILCFVKISG